MQDEDEPSPTRRRLVPAVLDPLGVAELQAYILELQAEIARAEAAIIRKQDQRGIADSFFRR